MCVQLQLRSWHRISKITNKPRSFLTRSNSKASAQQQLHVWRCESVASQKDGTLLFTFKTAINKYCYLAGLLNVIIIRIARKCKAAIFIITALNELWQPGEKIHCILNTHTNLWRWWQQQNTPVWISRTGCLGPADIVEMRMGISDWTTRKKPCRSKGSRCPCLPFLTFRSLRRQRRGVRSERRSGANFWVQQG